MVQVGLQLLIVTTAKHLVSNIKEIVGMKLFIIEAEVPWMDMSAGNPVDGPRWTGAYVWKCQTFKVVAAREGLAREFIETQVGETLQAQILSMREEDLDAVLINTVYEGKF